MSDFELAIKSTIDHVGKTLATSLGITDFVDLDDTVNSSEILSREGNAVIWRFMSLDESPRDPLFHLSFLIGVKTAYDSANYNLLGFVSKVKLAFPVGENIYAMDWSGTEIPTERLGTMYITLSGVDHQVMDRASGARLLTVEAMVTKLR